MEQLAQKQVDAVGHRAEGGARAVEVMALFDGAIVALDHRVPGAAWRDYTVGEPPGASFALPLGDAAASWFALVAASPAGVTVGAARVLLPDAGDVVVDVGAVTFRVRYVRLAPKLPRTLRPDWRAHRYLGASLLVAACFLGLVFSAPPDLKSLSLDAFGAEQRFMRLTLLPPEEKLPELPHTDAFAGPPGAKGRRAKGPSGVTGSKTAKSTHKRFAVAGPADTADPHLARKLADTAKSAGILGILHSGQSALMASLTGTHDSALGTAATSAMGGLLGTEVGDSLGDDALGLVGHGPGGGGTGPDTIGVGDLGRIGASLRNGHGPGGYGYPPTAKLGPHVPRPELPVEGKTIIVGSLDKELVRRVIRRHLNEVRFCYERELGRRPELYGRVVVQFTIAPTGNVITSALQSSTLGAPEAEQCIAQAVRRWEFPKPPGGLVMVSYPFVLQHAGAAAE